MKVSELIEKLRAMPPDMPVLLDTMGSGTWNSFEVEQITDDVYRDVVMISPMEMPEPDSADMYGRGPF